MVQWVLHQEMQQQAGCSDGDVCVCRPAFHSAAKYPGKGVARHPQHLQPYQRTEWLATGIVYGEYKSRYVKQSHQWK